MSGSKEPQEPRTTLEGVILGWWRTLEEDRGGRAELRRCNSPAEVALVPAFHRLLARIRQVGSKGTVTERLATLAGILAHIERESEHRTFGRALASGDGKPAISGLRFRRLLRVDEPGELMTALVRVVRQLDRAAPVAPLCRDVLHWGDATRMRWARDYYEATPSEP